MMPYPHGPSLRKNIFHAYDLTFHARDSTRLDFRLRLSASSE